MDKKALIKKLRRIEIHTARLANEQLAGEYHSVFKGRGMAFAEARPYQPGDDVRFIDWNVTARMNEPFVKVFTEEREMTVMLVVDLSASGDFGTQTQTKRETVAEVAALLAFSAIQNNDRVGLILFTDKIERFVPPKKGRGHVMRVITEILSAEPTSKGTDIAAGLSYLASLSVRRAVAFVVSDFIGDGYDKPLALAARKHDLIPVEIGDPRERELPDIGLALVEDLETGEVLEVDTSDRAVRDFYRAQVQMERGKRLTRFQRLRLDHVSIDAGDDYLAPLSKMFRARRRRLGGYR